MTRRIFRPTSDILCGDSREILPALENQSIDCCVTSPPYWGLRDYGHGDQIGLEKTPDEYVAKLVGVFREVRRVLKDDGTLWLNLGDAYASQPSWGRGGGSTLDGRKQGHENGGSIDRRKSGLKPKDLIGIPWRVALALQADGWYLRSDIIWHKPNPMPESVHDRPTKAHEYVFLLSKSGKYFYDHEAIKEDAVKGAAGSRFDKGKTGEGNSSGRAQSGYRDSGPKRNARSVWTIATRPFKQAHFATFPPDLAQRCILAGCPAGGTVLDPFAGAGTTGLVATSFHRNFIGIEINEEYAVMAENRIKDGGHV